MMPAGPKTLLRHPLVCGVVLLLKDRHEVLGGLVITNLEAFINGMDPAAPKRAWPTPRTCVDLWKTDPPLRERLAR